MKKKKKTLKKLNDEKKLTTGCWRRVVSEWKVKRLFIVVDNFLSSITLKSETNKNLLFFICNKIQSWRIIPLFVWVAYYLILFWTNFCLPYLLLLLSFTFLFLFNLPYKKLILFFLIISFSLTIPHFSLNKYYPWKSKYF